jgi:hypothetical protein
LFVISHRYLQCKYLDEHEQTSELSELLNHFFNVPR